MKDAYIDETAKMVKARPSYEDEMLNPPGMELPRLRCFLSFKDDPNKPYIFQTVGGAKPGIRLFYNVEKEFSRLNSKRVIPELMKEINVRKDPQGADRRISSIAVEPYISSAIVDALKGGDKDTWAKHNERINHLMGGNGGSGS